MGSELPIIMIMLVNLFMEGGNIKCLMTHGMMFSLSVSVLIKTCIRKIMLDNFNQNIIWMKTFHYFISLFKMHYYISPIRRVISKSHKHTHTHTHTHTQRHIIICILNIASILTIIFAMYKLCQFCCTCDCLLQRPQSEFSRLVV